MIIVLSPHLDDAVLSLGAAIAGWAADGREVEIWTLYTAGPPLEEIPPAQRPFGDYATRRAEDEAALAMLGARPRHLGVWERIWREPPVRGVTGVFRTPPDVSGFARLDEVRAIAADALSRPGADVLAPLGVGGHVDHVELALATWQAMGEDDGRRRVTFYEDFYALSERARRRHPVTVRAPRALRDSPGLAVPAGLPALGALGAVGRGPSLERYAPAVATTPWRADVVPVRGFEDAKLRAVAAYRSQAALLGPLARSLPRILRRQHERRGGEPVWRVG